MVIGTKVAQSAKVTFKCRRILTDWYRIIAKLCQYTILSSGPNRENSISDRILEIERRMIMK